MSTLSQILDIAETPQLSDPVVIKKNFTACFIDPPDAVVFE